MAYKYFRQFGKNWLIFSMNIKYKKINDYLRYIPDFYKEILHAYVCVYMHRCVCVDVGAYL
jgi:hypothetical protein